MQLVFVAHRGGAAFQIADISALVGNDQGTLELTGLLGIDAKVSGQLHRAAYSGGDIAERPVAEHSRVERGEVVVGVGHDRAEVLPHQLGVLAHRLRERTENDAELAQFRLECGGYRDAVEYRIHGDAREQLTFPQGHTQLLVGAQQLWIDLVQRLGPGLLGAWRGIVSNGLVVDGRVPDCRPVRLGHRQPVTIGLEAPVKHEFRLVLHGRDHADHVLVQPARHRVRCHGRVETVLIALADQFVELVRRGCHVLPSIAMRHSNACLRPDAFQACSVPISTGCNVGCVMSASVTPSRA